MKRSHPENFSTSESRFPASWSYQDVIAIACFFLSGVAGLIYEIVWIRQASLIFGSTIFAVSTVLAVFFLGLALGSYLFAGISRRSARPLRLYALLEIALGLFALLSLYGFELAGIIYGYAYRFSGDGTVFLFAVRVVLVALIILPPTIAMGATLPLFCRRFVVHDQTIAASVGWLYGINTLGAAIGCAAGGFILLPALGLLLTVVCGAGLSILCGLIIIGLPISRQIMTPPASPASPTAHRVRVWPVYLLFFAVGFSALGAEVLWTRFLGLLIYNTVYTFTITLSVVLTGIVLGSVIASRFYDRSRLLAGYFGALQVANALCIAGLMLLPASVWQSIDNMAVYFVALLVPAILSGASFPLAVRLITDAAAEASLVVGKLAAFNTLGGIFGSLLVGFAVLPLLGLQAGLLIITAIGLATGIGAWLWLDRRSSALLRYSAASVGLLAWLAIPLLSASRLPDDYLQTGGELIDVREGYGADLAVLRKDNILRLEIDRLWQGHSQKSHQIMAAHIPMMLHPDPQRVLVVGVGSGQTPARFLMHDPQQLDAVDIEPTIFEFIGRHFGRRWMDDARVRLIREDGRNYIAHSAARYDIISLELGQIFRPGVPYFYTADFYEQARDRLRPGGYLVQFVPLPFFTEEQFKGAIRTFLQVFPQSQLWYNTSELLLVGVNADRFSFDAEQMQRLTADPQIREDLDYAYWDGAGYYLNQPNVLLAGFLMGPDALAEMAGTGEIYKDDRPVLDYAASEAYLAQANELPLLELLKSHLQPPQALPGLSGGDIDSTAIEQIRNKNLAEITASVYIRQAGKLIPAGRFEEIIADLRQAVAANPEHLTANRMLADALMETQQFQQARDHYARALKMRPNDTQVMLKYATALQQLQDLDNAIRYYREVLKIRPDSADAHNNLGAALAQRGRFQEALPHMQEAVRLKPGDVNAQRNLLQLQTVLKSAPAK